MLDVPIYISLAFILITLTTLAILYQASHSSKLMATLVMLWALAQALLAYFGFYSDDNLSLPRMFVIIGPALILIVILFFTNKGKLFIDGLDLAQLTLLHTIRVPVELVLYLLFIHQTIPDVMTFEGRNYDILAGITAPFVFYFGFRRKLMSKDLLLAWNYISLFLLLNVVVYAILSLELPFQQFGIEQPNRAIRYFPFVWLPSIVVPIVLFSHLAIIRRLWLRE